MGKKKNGGVDYHCLVKKSDRADGEGLVSYQGKLYEILIKGNGSDERLKRDFVGNPRMSDHYIASVKGDTIIQLTECLTGKIVSSN